jgi:transposase
MGREIRAEYAQQLLLPVSLEEWVGPQHPARMVRELVDSLDVEALGFERHDEVDGRPHYGSNLLLKVWLYGYLVRIRSSRKLEQGCRDSMALIWLAGRHEPDHNTLWRFFRSNRGAIGKVFKAVVRLAVKAGVVGVVLHAVDGTKVAAQASRRGVWEKKNLEKMLEELDLAVEEVMAQVEANEASESGECRLPEDWEQRVLRREMLRELLEDLEGTERRYGHALERESRVMPVEGRKAPGYNAQIAVDSESGLIVGEVVTNEETDSHQLVSVMDEVKENVGEVAAETVADAGYFNAAELGKAQERTYPVIVNEPTAAERPIDPQGEFHNSRFVYDAQRDCCTCPRGKVLRFERVRPAHGSHHEERRYRCTSYQTCPVRWQCSADARGRAVDIGKFHVAVNAQREKLRDGNKLAQLRRRKAIVEAPFGTIKEGMGFRRWTVAGIDSVRAQWALICTAFDLRKLYPHWTTGRLAFQ